MHVCTLPTAWDGRYAQALLDVQQGDSLLDYIEQIARQQVNSF